VSGVRERAVIAPPLAALRQAVDANHRRLERHALMRHLLSPDVCRFDYGVFLTGLLPLYRTMERALALTDDPLCGIFRDTTLRREAALTRDLQVLASADALQPDCEEDVAGLVAELELIQGDPIALAAMAYVRYFGDLAGGQALARHFARRIGLTDPPGGAFYQFLSPAGAVSAGQKLQGLRQNLGRQLETPAIASRFTAAAVAAFDWHFLLFDLLWTHIGQSPQHLGTNKVLATHRANP
jgi:heme oxygenase